MYFTAWNDDGVAIDIERKDGKTVSLYFKNSKFSQSVQ